MASASTTIPLAAMMVACAAVPAAAGERPATLAMTCRSINELVSASGQLVMSTGPHTYQRYVASAAFCDHAQAVAVSFAAALDTPHCPVRFICIVPYFEVDVSMRTGATPSPVD